MAIEILLIEPRTRESEMLIFADVLVSPDEVRQIEFKLSDLITPICENCITEYCGDMSGVILDLSSDRGVICISEKQSYTSAIHGTENTISSSVQKLDFFKYYEQFDGLIEKSVYSLIEKMDLK